MPNQSVSPRGNRAPRWRLSLTLLAICTAIVNANHCSLPSVAQELDVEPTRPNVVLLLADDLGVQDIGCYGGPVKTPALDRLAANGVRFTNFYSGAPVCSTARATLLTGRQHLRTGVYTVIQDHMHDMHLRKREITIAEALGANGYQTVHLGKWHLGTPFRGRDKPWIDEHGFDDWFATDLNAAPSHRNPTNFWRNRERVGELNGYACQLVADEAMAWLDQRRDPRRPFFLNIWFHEPHAPLAAPAQIIREYGDENDIAAIYSATIDNTDRAIARIVEKLQSLGQLDNTIIVYTSDHGSYRHERNGGLRNGKGSLFEGGIRVPGIVHWPQGIRNSHLEETPAGAVDILPTLCGLTGVSKPVGPKLDGADLSPLLTGNKSQFVRPKPLMWHSPLSQPAVALREQNFSLVGWRSQEYPKDQQTIKKVMDQMRLILERKSGQQLSPQELWLECYNNPLKTPEWNRLRQQFVTLNTFQEGWIPFIKSGSNTIDRFELFDLASDPQQRHNVAHQFPEIMERLQQKLLDEHQSVLDDAHDWSTKTEPKNETAVHRLQSKQRSVLDAFLYVNRIPNEPESGETAEDLGGRILGRLANQEGRILVKLPPGMNRMAYDGFKIAVESGPALHAGRCFECHRLPALDDETTDPKATSLRNRTVSIEGLQKVIDDPTHHDIKLDTKDLQCLHSLLQTLRDVPDPDFRDLILQATVLDTSGDLE